MKKRGKLTSLLFAVFLCLCMCLVPLTASAEGAHSGTCGSGVSWSLNARSGVLVISGQGAMEDSDESPFSEHAQEIRSVEIESGVTGIGSNAFAGCSSLISVSIPDTVSSIGAHAFSGCSSLTDVSVPDTVSFIGEGAFSGCTALTELTIPSSVTSVGDHAFASCYSLAKAEYEGSAAQWKRVSVGEDNSSLTDHLVCTAQITWSPLKLVLLVCLVVVILAVVVAAVICLGRTRRKPASPPQKSVPALDLPQVGKVHQQGDRESQQDSFSITPPEQYPAVGLCAVLADGMGGLQDGDRVSQAAVQAMINQFWISPTDPPEDLLLGMLRSGVLAVSELLGPERITHCGSTALLGLLRDGWFYYLSVGDSKILLYRNGRITVLNREHNFRRELELRAINGETTLEEARTHPRAAGLTSYLGMGPLALLDQPTGPVAAEAGDKFVLMSDGVWNALTQEELSQALAGDAQSAAEAIRQAVEAKAWPGQDNYTAVILEAAAVRPGGEEESYHDRDRSPHQSGGKA